MRRCPIDVGIQFRRRVVLVRDDLRVSDDGGGSEKSAVELAPSMGGRWLVTTQGSTHEWDLDAMTYMRMPGAESRSGGFPMDGERVLITRVGRWPRVGSTSFLWCDDPASPDRLEHWRQSSTIVSITPLPDDCNKTPDPVSGGQARRNQPAPLGGDGSDC